MRLLEMEDYTLAVQYNPSRIVSTAAKDEKKPTLGPKKRPKSPEADVIRFLNVRVDELATAPSIMMKKNAEEAE